MKNNTFKRVLAGSLALLTVAAYMPANVGGLIQARDTFVANAGENSTSKTIDFKKAREYLTSLSQDNSNFKPFNENQLSVMSDVDLFTDTATTLTSKVPLNFALDTEKTNTCDVKETVTYERVQYIVRQDIELPNNAGVITRGTCYKDANALTTDIKTKLGNQGVIIDVRSNGNYPDLLISIQPTAAAGAADQEANDRSYSEHLLDINAGNEQLEKFLSTEDIKTYATKSAADADVAAAADALLAVAKTKEDINREYNGNISENSTTGVITATGTGTNTITFTEYADFAILPVDQSYEFNETKQEFTIPAATENGSPTTKTAAVVMKEMLEDAHYETADNTYIANSKFVTKDNKVYLFVNFSANETEKDGVYTYNFTMPNSAVTVDTVKQNADLAVYNTPEDPNVQLTFNDLTTTDGDHWDLQVKNGASGADIMRNGNEDDNNALPFLENLIVGETVTITNPKAFALEVYYGNSVTNGAGVREDNPLVPDVTYKDGRYTTTFKMPKALDQSGVTFKLVSLQEEYTFAMDTTKTKLLANSKSGSVKDAEAASLTVKTYDSASDMQTFGTETDKGKATASTVENGKFIVIKPAFGSDLIVDTPNKPEFVIKKDGINVTDTAVVEKVVDKENEQNVLYYKINTAKAGDYEVTYKVYANDGASQGQGTPYTLEKKFTVKAKGALTTNDISLGLTVMKDNQPVTGEALRKLFAKGTEFAQSPNVTTAVSVPEDNTKPDEVDVVKAVRCNKDGSVEFMLGDGIAEEVRKANYQFTIVPVVGDVAEAYYTVTGSKSGSKLDNDYAAEIKVTDPEYGGSSSKPQVLNVKWSVKEYVEVPEFKPTVGTISVAMEDVDTLEGTIFASIPANNTARALDPKVVTYDYVVGIGAEGTEDELDEFIDGLPTKIGSYTVYAHYNDNRVSRIPVVVTAYRLNFVPEQSDLSITYSDKLELSKYTLEDVNGNAVTNVTAENIDVEFLVPVYDEQGKLTGYQSDFSHPYDINNPVPKRESFDSDEAYQTALDSYYSNYKENKAKYESEHEDIMVDYYKNTAVGKYANALAKELGVKAATIDFSAFVNGENGNKFTLADVPTLEAGTYYVRFNARSSDPDNYTIQSDVYEVKVAKKKLSDKSVAILINPIMWDGKPHNIVEEKTNRFTARDTKTNADISGLLKVTEGATKTNVGVYNATVGLMTSTRNYVGTTESKWRIVNKEANAVTGIAWNNDMTTLYDNGRIHVEINRNANDKITNSTGSTSIAKFGVVIEKDGLLAAPADYKNYTNDEIAAVESQLLVGNGFTEGGYTASTNPKAKDSLIYKANIKVTGIDTGIWARPYILFEDGTVAYGAVKYLNLTNEAIEKLNLQMPVAEYNKSAVRQADLTEAQKKEAYKYAKAGYDPIQNKFYAYATFEDIKNSDKFPEGSVLQVSNFGVVLDKTGTVPAPANAADVKPAETAKAKEMLKIDGGSYLTVGHYDPKNKAFDYNEYAANIKPANSVTGIWVTPYLDLGEGLVIYGEPAYIQDASNYFGGAPELSASLKDETGKDKQSILLTIAANNLASQQTAVRQKLGASTNVKITKSGVVLDKKGLLPTGVNAYTDLIMESKTTFINGGKAQQVNGADFTDYVGKVTAVTGKDLIARSYVVYTIDGKTNITVYGQPKVFAYDAENDKWSDVNDPSVG